MKLTVQNLFAQSSPLCSGLRRIQRHRDLYLMLVPVFILFGIFMFWPMWWLSISFKDFYVLRGFRASQWVGFKHYISFFAGRDAWMLIRNTLVLNVYSIIFAFPTPIIFALLLNEVHNRAVSRVVQTLTYLPHFVSTVVLVAIVTEFLSPSTGTLNLILRKLGAEPVFFMAKESLFRTIYIGSGIWQETGWQSIIYLAALSSIDMQLYEAARIDGAGRWSQLWNVTLPSIMPTVIVMFLLRVGYIVNVSFEKIWLMSNEANRQVSEVIATYTFRRGILNMDYSYATAVELFNSVIALVMVVLANYLSRRTTNTSLW